MYHFIPLPTGEGLGERPMNFKEGEVLYFNKPLGCKWMINIVKKGKLVYFAVYCAIAGIVTIVLSQMQG